MQIQIGLNRGGEVAVRAFEGLLTAMDAGVVLDESTAQSEPLSAFIKFEGLSPVCTASCCFRLVDATKRLKQNRYLKFTHCGDSRDQTSLRIQTVSRPCGGDRELQYDS